MSDVSKIVLSEKLSSFSEHWAPHRIAALNGQDVKLAKLKGDFVWHHHDNEDEFFMVLEGRFRMDLRDRQIWVEPGEAILIPRGVEHKPYAEEEASVLLFEPSSTVNTGNVLSDRTRPTVPDL